MQFPDYDGEEIVIGEHYVVMRKPDYGECCPVTGKEWRDGWDELMDGYIVGKHNFSIVPIELRSGIVLTGSDSGPGGGGWTWPWWVLRKLSVYQRAKDFVPSPLGIIF